MGRIAKGKTPPSGVQEERRERPRVARDVWGGDWKTLEKTVRRAQRVQSKAIRDGETDAAAIAGMFLKRLNFLHHLLGIVLANPSASVDDLGRLLVDPGQNPISRNGVYARLAIVGYSSVKKLLMAWEKGPEELLNASIVFKKLRKLIEGLDFDGSRHRTLQRLRQEPSFPQKSSAF